MILAVAHSEERSEVRVPVRSSRPDERKRGSGLRMGKREIASGMKKLAMTGVNWNSHAPITGNGISELRMVKGYNDAI